MASKADLKPTNINIGSLTSTPGGLLTVSWSLSNVGTDAANSSSSTQVRITQSSSSYGNSSNNVGSAVFTAALAAGASVSQSATVTVPTTPGVYYIWIIADNYGQVSQSNIVNDELASPAFTVTAAQVIPTLSNVTPTSYTADSNFRTMRLFGSNFASNDTLTFQYPDGTTQQNHGAISFQSAGEIDYQFNDGGTAGQWGVRVDSADGTLHSGYQYFSATATQTAPTLSNVTPNPDQTDSTAVQMRLKGSNFAASDTLNFVYPDGTSHKNNLPITFISGSEIDYAFNPSGKDGQWSVQVSSADNANVSSALTFQVQPAPSQPIPDPGTKPNLVINDLTLGQSSAPSNGGLDISFAIGNAGGASAGASTAKLYLSSDPGITKNLTLLGTFAIPALAPAGSYNTGLSVLLPIGLIPGAYYIGVIADTANVVTDETSKTDNSYSKSLTVTAPSNAWSGSVTGLDGATFNATISRVDGAPIDSSKPTWVFVHGLNSDPSIFANLISQVAKQRPSDQFLTLDWSKGAGGGPLDVNAGLVQERIPFVAGWAYDQFVKHNFSSSSLNFIGHSFGSYISDEIAKNYFVNSSNKINSIVALDPAANAPGANHYNSTASVNFSTYTSQNKSWSFLANVTPVQFGNETTAATASEAFLVEGPGINGPGIDPFAAHHAVVDVFANLLAQSSDSTSRSQYFSIAALLDGQLGPWRPNQYSDSALFDGAHFDAIIYPDASNIPISIAYIDPSATSTFIADSTPQVIQLDSTVRSAMAQNLLDTFKSDLAANNFFALSASAPTSIPFGKTGILQVTDGGNYTIADGFSGLINTSRIPSF